MKFARDILLIDMETTGPDPAKDFPLQLAGVILYMYNVLQNAKLNTYIRHYFSQ